MEVKLTVPGAAMVVPKRRVAMIVVAFMFETRFLVDGVCCTEFDGILKQLMILSEGKVRVFSKEKKRWIIYCMRLRPQNAGS